MSYFRSWLFTEASKSSDEHLLTKRAGGVALADNGVTLWAQDRRLLFKLPV
jgi:hypothetical protein